MRTEKITGVMIGVIVLFAILAVVVFQTVVKAFEVSEKNSEIALDKNNGLC